VARRLDPPPLRRLQSSGDVMAHAKLRTIDRRRRDVFADWLAQARAFEEA
jgi:hypothetical protein